MMIATKFQNFLTEFINFSSSRLAEYIARIR